LNIPAAVDASIAYLSSTQGIEHLHESPYWPKWDGPWWHMLLLHEMGETRRIPEVAIRSLIAAIEAAPLKIFPVPPDDLPAGAERPVDDFCHCQLGCLYGLLDAWGVDVDEKLPWISQWFTRYQMADGGLNCDDTAYRVTCECASSMVGTISAFEALVYRTRRPWREEERLFVDRAAAFMIGRRLNQGSASRHNAEEREAARHWSSLCFPRFYHYDVLRGLAALTAWAERTQTNLPRACVDDVVGVLDTIFPDGEVKIGRRCTEGIGTVTRRPDGTWDHERRPAASFALLDAVSAPGIVSPYLTRQWRDVRPRAVAMKE
jgi:hypothetical protein